MRLFRVITSILTFTGGFCDKTGRQPLTYAPIPEGVYVPLKNSSTLTLLDFVKSRSDLSILAEIVEKLGGFSQAFDTAPQWTYTFLAPSNAAFNNTGIYYSTYAATPKGEWWLGNLIQHHYIPNSKLLSSTFSTGYSRVQSGSYLYIGAQVIRGQLMLNNVSAVTTADLPVTSGIVHIIDHILDPSAQIFEPDVTKTTQGFIPGSCSNLSLPYC